MEKPIVNLLRKLEIEPQDYLEADVYFVSNHDNRNENSPIGKICNV